MGGLTRNNRGAVQRQPECYILQRDAVNCDHVGYVIPNVLAPITILYGEGSLADDLEGARGRRIVRAEGACIGAVVANGVAVIWDPEIATSRVKDELESL